MRPLNTGYRNIKNRHTKLRFSRSFYFEALYARIGHILLEISTDGPGFMVMNPMKR